MVNRNSAMDERMERLGYQLAVMSKKTASQEYKTEVSTIENAMALVNQFSGMLQEVGADPQFANNTAVGEIYTMLRATGGSKPPKRADFEPNKPEPKKSILSGMTCGKQHGQIVLKVYTAKTESKMSTIKTEEGSGSESAAGQFLVSCNVAIVNCPRLF